MGIVITICYALILLGLRLFLPPGSEYPRQLVHNIIIFVTFAAVDALL